MSTRLRVFAWIVVAVAVAVWIAAVWFVVFQPRTAALPSVQAELMGRDKVAITERERLVTPDTAKTCNAKSYGKLSQKS